MVIRRGITIKHLIFIKIHLFILGFLVFFSCLTWNNYNIIIKWSKVVTNIVIILLSIQLISFKCKKIQYTDFRLWFIILTYLFMFGRVILNAYNLDSNIFWNLMNRHSELKLYHTSMFILCCIQSIFIGFIFNEDKGKIANKSIDIWKESSNELMYKVGLVLLIFSIPSRLYTDISWIIQTQRSSSYLALSVKSGLADDIAFLVIPSLLYINTSGKLKKRTVFIITLTSIFYFIVVMILTGDRRYPVTAILALILCFFKLYNIKIKLREIFTWGGAAYLMLNLLSVLRNIRRNDLTNVGNFIFNYGLDILFGISALYETLAEFGLSFFSVVHIFEYIPDYIPFQYGFSFVGSIPSILPIGWLFGDFFFRVSISNIINSLAGAPVGASLIGDLYANFGWLAIPIAIIVGIYASRIFRIENRKKCRLECAQYYALFYILINLVRASFFEIFRSSIIVYFVPVFIMWVFSNRYKTNNKNKIKKKMFL